MDLKKMTLVAIIGLSIQLLSQISSILGFYFFGMRYYHSIWGLVINIIPTICLLMFFIVLYQKQK